MKVIIYRCEFEYGDDRENIPELEIEYYLNELPRIGDTIHETLLGFTIAEAEKHEDISWKVAEVQWIVRDGVICVNVFTEGVI